MSKLRNIILFLFGGAHRLRPQPQYRGQHVAPVFLYPQRPPHEGAASYPGRTGKRVRHIKRGRGDAFDDSSTDGSFKSTNNSQDNVTIPTGSQVAPTRLQDSSMNAPTANSIDVPDSSYEQGTDEVDTDSSSTPMTTQSSQTSDPYPHYLQEENFIETGEVSTASTTTSNIPAINRTYTPSTSPPEWYIDIDDYTPTLFPRHRTTTTVQPRESLNSFYNRSPKIPVRHNATSTLRQELVKPFKKKLPAPSSLIKRKQIPGKWPVISSRDWRVINGIHLWSDRLFEKDEYIIEDGERVKKYESKRWKQFVQDIQLSLDKLSHVTKIHMPLPLPDFIIDMMEREYR